MKTIIRNAQVVNEGRIFSADVLVVDDRIDKIANTIQLPSAQKYQEINAERKHLFPGVIDGHVHFREPGLTYKGEIASESAAAVAGGVTSFMDMPNTYPNTLTQRLLEDKYKIAQNRSLANYSFFMGVNRNNLEEALKTDTETVCGVTDDGLYFDTDQGILANRPEYLEMLFARSETLVALHSEDEQIIQANYLSYYRQYGEAIPVHCHPSIRSEQACVSTTQALIKLAQKHYNRLHLLHVSTVAEAKMFDALKPVREKRITAEVCPHYLWFSEQAYRHIGNKIRWNPAIKTEKDRKGLLSSLLEHKIDIVASDHAPHAAKEKVGSYSKVLSGAPMVQHSLSIMLELYHQGKITPERVAEKMSHNVADIYRIRERGYLREGYFADMILVDLDNTCMVKPDNMLYKCGWSPLTRTKFRSRVTNTFVNGAQVYEDGCITGRQAGQRLLFEKYR